MTAPPLAGDPVRAFRWSRRGSRTRGSSAPENEDAFGSFVENRLFIVADGMGGHNAGEVAAAMAIDTVEGFFTLVPRRPAPDLALRRRSRAVARREPAARRHQGRATTRSAKPPTPIASRARMGATVVAMAVGETQVAIAHAGDSRAYRLRDGELKRLTRDHSIAEEMRAARPEMTDEELAGFAHRNVVMRSLGSKDELEPDVYVNKVASGDLYLLCTDGLWGIGARRQDRRHPPIHRRRRGGLPAADRRRQRGRRARQHHGAAGASGLAARACVRMIEALVRDNRVLVCVGPGGVGKTTIAAAAGALAARRGKRTLVCTIDPAPRLADALGTGGLGAEPQPLPPEACRALGIDGGGGELHAVRIDTEATFERLVNECGRRSRDAAADLRQRDLPADHHDADRVAGVRGDAGAARLRRERSVRSRRARHAADRERARFPGSARAHRGRGVQPGADLVRAPAPGGQALLAAAAAFGRGAAGAPAGEAGRQQASSTTRARSWSIFRRC